ncbi:MAG: ATP-binding protein [Akkermansia sp.]|nr:ATP-binding protein [Akkermansia sp.]
MNRHAEQQLLKWKESSSRKPLLIMGARQVGKTWLMQEFGRKYYSDVAYISFDSNENMRLVFESGFDVKRILLMLQAETAKSIHPEKTLIIFDEVQECPRALTALKYFCENAREYHIIAAGSLLGLQVNSGSGFPVGKVDMINLYPMTFSEFLEAEGQQNLAQLAESIDLSMVNAFAARFADLLKQYYFVGGMPEAVSTFVRTHDFSAVRKVHQALLAGYRKDFSKHAPKELSPRLSQIWNSIPQQLARENKKFICKDVAPGLRMRDMECALQWLTDAGLIHIVHRLTKPAFPPAAYRDKVFKVFFADVGLLAAMADLQAQTILEGNRIFTEFKGALAEQYVQQELRASGEKELFYWSSNQSDVEIDFVFSSGAAIIPIEVKAEINLRAKSLFTFCRKQQVKLAMRTSMAPFAVNTIPGKTEDDNLTLLDIPLYAIEQAYALCEKWQQS